LLFGATINSKKDFFFWIFFMSGFWSSKPMPKSIYFESTLITDSNFISGLTKVSVSFKLSVEVLFMGLIALPSPEVIDPKTRLSLFAAVFDCNSWLSDDDYLRLSLSSKSDSL
jgi:hypothetical protein